jgi:hypothetical protein
VHPKNRGFGLRHCIASKDASRDGIQFLTIGHTQVEGKVEKGEAWVKGCDEGDALTEAAKRALDEGELDEASKGCRGAREAYERVQASEQLRGLEQVEGQIAKKRHLDEAEDELADGCVNSFPHVVQLKSLFDYSTLIPVSA